MSDLFEPPPDQPGANGGGGGRHRRPGMTDRLREANQEARKERDRRRAIRLMQKLGPDAPDLLSGTAAEATTGDGGGQGQELSRATRWEDAAIPAPFRFS